MTDHLSSTGYIDHPCLVKETVQWVISNIAQSQKFLFIFKRKNVFCTKPSISTQTFFFSHVRPVELCMELCIGEPGRYSLSQRQNLPAPQGKHILFLVFFKPAIQREVKFWKSKFTSLLSFEALLTNVASLSTIV